MTLPSRAVTPLAPTTTATDRQTHLRRLCHDMEGIFLRQLFEAMREGIPKTNLFGESKGEAMFTSLLDDELSTQAAQKSTRGLGEALYHQLARRLDGEG